MQEKLAELQDLLAHSGRTQVFTGAGISTLSGIPDFRSPQGVYSAPWHGMAVEEILSLECFRAHPEYFYHWARSFVYNLDRFEPNVVHRVCAEMEKRGIIRGVYTQNIDLLHRRAGSVRVGEIHGSPALHHCLRCNATATYAEVAPLVTAGEVPRCRRCGGVLKPDIVFYGESLDEELLERAFRDMGEAELTLVLGSSLTVQPAASLPQATRCGGGRIVIVNAQPTALDRYAALHFSDLEAVFSGLEQWLAP